jgi:4-diphosphocytidyl-2-C-methyl-D-erythritol kinase
VSEADPARTRGLRAHAKVNLGLSVTGIRPDGYHELASVFLRLALADELAVRPGLAATDTLVIEGAPDCPVEGNLVLRAAGALRAAAGGSHPSLAFTLRKRIPMGGGLAGGSTDAAAALRLAAETWGVRLDPADALALATRLGADVPFFVSGAPAALVQGIGERVVPLPPLRTPVGVLLVTPPFAMATPAVFAAYDRSVPVGTGSADAVASLADAWSLGLDGPGLAALAGGLREANDLWPAVTALEPAMARLRDGLEELLGCPALLTGSGSTLVGLYPSPGAASEAATRLATVTGALAGVAVTATRDEPGAGHEDVHP